MIRKQIFTPLQKAIDATRRFYRRRKLARAVRRILRTVDLKRFEHFQKKYANLSPDPGYSKYLDIEQRMLMTVQDVFLLRLHEARPLRILDIGTGCGYFPYACQWYGHSVTGLDRDDIPMYNEITSFLNLDRCVAEVRRFEGLPDLGQRFDLITAIAVCFDRHSDPDVWGPREWQFFLSDLATRHLEHDGRVFLRLNTRPDGANYSDELREFFLSHGARVQGPHVYFSSMRKFTERALATGLES